MSDLRAQFDSSLKEFAPDGNAENLQELNCTKPSCVT